MNRKVEVEPSNWPNIYIAPVPSIFQPASAPFRYPSYAKDWGVEQDFLQYLETRYPNIASSPGEADWIYVPIFWTRYHLTNDFGAFGIEPLVHEVERLTGLGTRLFTVCQYDDGPLVTSPNMRVFLASRKIPNGDDAPLLATGLPRTLGLGSALPKFLATFIGRPDTHPIRKELEKACDSIPAVRLITKPISPRHYAFQLQRSLVTLAPRGYGGSSFRFYEAIQKRSVPWLIGDIDTRPFKKSVDWDAGSFYSPSVDDFVRVFPAITRQDIEEKRRHLLEKIRPQMILGHWQHNLIRELESGLQSI